MDNLVQLAESEVICPITMTILRNVLTLSEIIDEQSRIECVVEKMQEQLDDVRDDVLVAKIINISVGPLSILSEAAEMSNNDIHGTI